MRFMMMATEAVTKMTEYNKSLQKAGVLLAVDELYPPSTGARISYVDGKPAIAQSQEIISGYWIIDVRSREEAIEWAKRAPISNNEVIEIRQIHDA